jgi:hypothetical protein
VSSPSTAGRRSPPDRSRHASRTIEDLPGDGRLWYTDGSTISSEPIGRVLTLLALHTLRVIGYDIWRLARR